jgi:hypothetical protein
MTPRYGLLLALFAVPATAPAQTAADSSSIPHHGSRLCRRLV